MSSKFFNLHVDSLVTKSSYQKKISTYRCVIPMDGFYLWKQVAKKQSIPYFISYPDKRVFTVAGYWEEGDNTNAFSILMQDSNDQIAEIQDDMPVILTPSTSKKWLATAEFKELESILLTAERNDKFVTHTVSPLIKNLEINDASLINPAPASDQHGNYTLFS
jgi:putative SOS response-associated peptidase YedK